MMAQWTDASRTMLIQEYQTRPILWDRRVNDLNSRVSKADALSTVTALLNEKFCPMVTKRQYSVDDVKQQWKNLKDTFVRKQRWVNEGKYSRDPQEEPSWKFYRLLKFIDLSDGSPSPESPVPLSTAERSVSSSFGSAGSSSFGIVDVKASTAFGAATSFASTSSAPTSPHTTHSNHVQDGAVFPGGSHLSSTSNEGDLLSILMKQKNANFQNGLKGDQCFLGDHPTTSDQMLSLLASISSSTSSSRTAPPVSASLVLPPHRPRIIEEEEDEANTSTSPSSAGSNDKAREERNSNFSCMLHVPASMAPLVLPPSSYFNERQLASSSACSNMPDDASIRLVSSSMPFSSHSNSSLVEPASKKRKSYDSRIASLLAANISTLSQPPLSALAVSPREMQQSSRLPEVTQAAPPPPPSLPPPSSLPHLAPSNHTERQDLDLFGEMVGASLKRLTSKNPARALRLQKGIYDLIYEANLQELE